VFAPRSRKRPLAKPISTAFIGGSVSAYTDLNPNYKVYYSDGGYTGASWVKFFNLIFLAFLKLNLVLKLINFEQKYRLSQKSYQFVIFGSFRAPSVV
jgi:hypothetical protein